MKKLQLKWLGLVVLVAVLLAATNPGPKAYKRYLNESIVTKMVEKMPSGSQGGVSPAYVRISKILEATTRRDNYLLFSVYVTNFYDKNAGYLGVCGFFVPLG